MWYELWDVETGNQVGHYSTEEVALLAVRDTISRYGRHSDEVTSLGLLSHPILFCPDASKLARPRLKSHQRFACLPKHEGRFRLRATSTGGTHSAAIIRLP